MKRPRVPLSTEARDQPFDEPLTTEEIAGIDGVERAQPLVRIVDGSLRSSVEACDARIAAQRLVQVVDQVVDASVAAGGVDAGRAVDAHGDRIRQRPSKLVDLVAPTGQRLRDEHAEAVDVRPRRRPRLEPTAIPKSDR